MQSNENSMAMPKGEITNNGPIRISTLTNKEPSDEDNNAQTANIPILADVNADVDMDDKKSHGSSPKSQD